MDHEATVQSFVDRLVGSFDWKTMNPQPRPSPQNETPNPQPSTNSQNPEDAYFAFNPPPPTLSRDTAIAQEFITRHSQPTSSGTTRPIVLLTSGGTTVPLENQTVRFIDNFSAGTRGATSAEYFLEAGYAVVFLHRQYSLLPYSRHYSHSVDCFLDFMVEEEGEVVVGGKYQEKMLQVLRKYHDAKRQGTLLLLPFTSITEYLWLLRSIALLMKPLGANALFYLAAAVSDFFVPHDRMVEHKIQSGEEFQKPSSTSTSTSANTTGTAPATTTAAQMHESRLIIDLDPVPKFLKTLVDGWAPEGMIVSFKLETDPSLLMKKARGALEKYQHHCVVGNLLGTRKWEVVFVYREDASPKDGDSTSVERRRNSIKEKWLRVPLRRRAKSMSGVRDMVGRAQMPFTQLSLANHQDHPSVSSSSIPPTADEGNNTFDEHDNDDDHRQNGHNGGAGVGDGDGDVEPDPAVEIESLIVPEVQRLHEAFIARAGARSRKP